MYRSLVKVIHQHETKPREEDGILMKVDKRRNDDHLTLVRVSRA